MDTREWLIVFICLLPLVFVGLLEWRKTGMKLLPGKPKREWVKKEFTEEDIEKMANHDVTTWGDIKVLIVAILLVIPLLWLLKYMGLL